MYITYLVILSNHYLIFYCEKHIEINRRSWNNDLLSEQDKVITDKPITAISCIRRITKHTFAHLTGKNRTTRSDVHLLQLLGEKWVWCAPEADDIQMSITLTMLLRNWMFNIKSGVKCGVIVCLLWTISFFHEGDTDWEGTRAWTCSA